MTLSVVIMTPEKIVKEIVAQHVILNTITGQLGILPGHAPLITALDTGVLRMKFSDNNSSDYYSIVLGGVAEIKDDKIKLLVEGFEEDFEVPSDNDIGYAKEWVKMAKTEHEKLKATKSLKLLFARLFISNI
jgi:F-type H+-transporting ATPase subunit epsilon